MSLPTRVDPVLNVTTYQIHTTDIIHHSCSSLNLSDLIAARAGDLDLAALDLVELDREDERGAARDVVAGALPTREGCGQLSEGQSGKRGPAPGSFELCKGPFEVRIRNRSMIWAPHSEVV